ncbi:hypothetical protein LCGC14_3126390 [marine sediment metagenome]|uniref:Uncharacterized protein n=1 Tax=marine sediment metagenome TaxID=412755 RepID=A0A0F8WPP3_9ZZZZ
MDSHTFSDSPAAENLVAILTEGQYAQHVVKVNKILSQWFAYSGSVMAILDEKVRQGTLNLWRAHFLERLRGNSLPAIVESHACNVIVTRYRQCLRGIKDKT